MAMDILIIGIVTCFGVALGESIFSNPNLFLVLVCTVALQVLHDAVFTLVFQSVPRGNHVMDFFKSYAEEVRFAAVWSDSLMMIGTVLFAEGICRWDAHHQALALLISIYVGLFALYSKKPTAP